MSSCIWVEIFTRQSELFYSTLNHLMPKQHSNYTPIVFIVTTGTVYSKTKIL